MRRARAANEDGESPERRLRRHVAPAAEATAAAAAVGAGVTGQRQQQQQQQQDDVQLEFADDGNDESQQEGEENEAEYGEGDEDESEPGEAEEPEDEDEDDEEEDNEDDFEAYYDDGDAGVFTIPGTGDYDIVIGAPVEAPARASGAVPQVNLATDTEIAPGVFARQEPDGYHCLLGSPLRHVPKLLCRIFQMQQQRGQLLWKSSIVLTDEEWRYIKDALGHERIQPLLQRGQRVLKPLPETAFPQRLRPKDSSGSPLRGPFVSRNSGKPWNVGRQYFSSFKNGDFSGFMWADGVGAMEAEAQASFNQTMGGMFGMF